MEGNGGRYVPFQKWKEMVGGMFRSKNGRKWWTYYHPLLEGYYAEEILLQKWMEMTHFSYIVTKMSNNHPYLESFSLPLLDDSVIMKQSSIFGLF